MTEEVKEKQDSDIVYYCKDCQEMVAGVRMGTRYVYKCPECGSRQVALGTLRSIKEYYFRK